MISEAFPPRPLRDGIEKLSKQYGLGITATVIDNRRSRINRRRKMVTDLFNQ